MSLLLTMFMVLTVVALAQSDALLAPLQFPLGEREGVGDQAGATGGFTLAPGVQDRIIVRTNYAMALPPYGIIVIPVSS